MKGKSKCSLAYISTTLEDSQWKAVPTVPYVSFEDGVPTDFCVGWMQHGPVLDIFPYSLAYGAFSDVCPV